MKVLVIIDSLGNGGAERSLGEMAPELQSLGFEISVVQLVDRGGDVADLLRRAEVPVLTLRSSHRLGRLLELRSILATLRPEVVHTTLFESDVLGRLSAFGTSLPVLSSLVNMPYQPVRLTDPRVHRSKLGLARALDRWTARHLTSHFHAITEAVKGSTIETMGIPAERITVVHRGRSRARLGHPSRARRETARATLGVSSDHRLLVNVGRQEFQKGQRFLLEAVAALRSEHPGLRLVIAGREGAVSRELSDLLRTHELMDRVEILGHVSHVEELLAAADLFVFPSLFEGLGGAVLEAMAMGLPIVASDLPPVREVVEPDGNASLVDPGSSTALARAITSLIDDSGRMERYGRRSRELFDQRFTLDRSVDGMADLYRKVAER